MALANELIAFIQNSWYFSNTFFVATSYGGTVANFMKHEVHRRAEGYNNRLFKAMKGTMRGVINLGAKYLHKSDIVKDLIARGYYKQKELEQMQRYFQNRRLDEGRQLYITILDVSQQPSVVGQLPFIGTGFVTLFPKLAAYFQGVLAKAGLAGKLQNGDCSRQMFLSFLRSQCLQEGETVDDFLNEMGSALSDPLQISAFDATIIARRLFGSFKTLFLHDNVFEEVVLLHEDYLTLAWLNKISPVVTEQVLMPLRSSCKPFNDLVRLCPTIANSFLAALRELNITREANTEAVFNLLFAPVLSILIQRHISNPSVHDITQKCDTCAVKLLSLQTSVNLSARQASQVVRLTSTYLEQQVDLQQQEHITYQDMMNPMPLLQSEIAAKFPLIATALQAAIVQLNIREYLKGRPTDSLNEYKLVRNFVEMFALQPRDHWLQFFILKELNTVRVPDAIECRDQLIPLVGHMVEYLASDVLILPEELEDGRRFWPLVTAQTLTDHYHATNPDLVPEPVEPEEGVFVAPSPTSSLR